MSATPELVPPPAAIAEEIAGGPASVAGVEAQGWARLFRAPGGLSASGDRVASPAGQLSWAMYEWARNPYVLVITIYLFAPYFANEVVGEGVRGQGLAGAIQSYSGIIIAVLAPFLGAIADNGGRRKPWIALYTVLMAAAMLPMWFAMPHSMGWQLFFVGALIAAANVAFEFSAVFHNSLLPTIASPRGVAGLSGLGLALGNAAGYRMWVTGRSEEKRAYAQALGAARTFEPGERLPSRVDAVMETVGEPTWKHSMGSIRKGGKIVVAGGTGGYVAPLRLDQVFVRNIRIGGVSMGTLEELERLVAFLVRTGVRPSIDSVIELDQIPDAMRRMEAGDLRGKVVVRV